MPPDLHQLYDDHAAALFAFLLNVTRSEADTRDVMQEVFVKLAARPALLDGVHTPRAFLLRLAHRLAIDGHRRRATRDHAMERAASEVPALFAPTADPDPAAHVLRIAVGRCFGDGQTRYLGNHCLCPP